MSTINKVHTPCKQCICAKYDKNTQIDCLLNYIELYKNNNIEILEAYDNEKEFYIINEKKCIGYRENTWFEKRNIDNLSIEEKVEYIKKGHFLHYMLIIDLKTINIANLEDLLKQSASLNIKPQKIILVRYQNENKNFPYESLKVLIDQYLPNIPWRIQTMLIDRTKEDILHELVNVNKKYRFVLYINSFNQDMELIIHKGDDILYKELGIFAVIRNVNNTAMLFSCPNYRYSLVVEGKDILSDDNYHIIL